MAGEVSLLLAHNPDLTPSEVKKIIVDGATQDVIENAGYWSPTTLLYIGKGMPNGSEKMRPDLVFVMMVLVVKLLF